MNIKNTRLWEYAKKIKNKRIAKLNYKRLKRMPLNEYENYLTERTFEMMLRKSYFAPHAYKINFDNPITFTEKRQWMKLYDQDDNPVDIARHPEEILKLQVPKKVEKDSMMRVKIL